jgi:hypothetical protein
VSWSSICEGRLAGVAYYFSSCSPVPTSSSHRCQKLLWEGDCIGRRRDLDCWGPYMCHPWPRGMAVGSRPPIPSTRPSPRFVLQLPPCRRLCSYYSCRFCSSNLLVTRALISTPHLRTLASSKGQPARVRKYGVPPTPPDHKSETPPCICIVVVHELWESRVVVARISFTSCKLVASVR